jgi:hypothetical protein
LLIWFFRCQFATTFSFSELNSRECVAVQGGALAADLAQGPPTVEHHPESICAIRPA